VFARTKRTAAKVADDLVERGFAAGALHGDLGQGAREQALRAFRHGKVDVLVATDVAARGIDVEAVTHVINYQCPEDEKTYLHRTGRTGRAGAKGTAVTFVDWDDIPRWGLIDKALGLGIPEPVETYSSSPHLFADLDIPEGTKGRLPKAQQTREGLGAEKLEDLGETGKRGGGTRPAGSDSRSGGDRGPRTGGSSAPRSSAPHAEGTDGDSRGRRRGGRGRGRGESGSASEATGTSNGTSAGAEGTTSGPTTSTAGGEPGTSTRRSRNRRRTRSGASTGTDGASAQAPATDA
jgi:superfamily II DNA/RNA helicase